MSAPADPPRLVEDLFRHRYGQLVAGLCRILGADRLDLVEDVVQEAMLSALRVWPAEGIPKEPAAWVFQVARNRALDALRRTKVADRVVRDLQAWAAGPAATQEEPAEGITDDTLRMMFACTHPGVPADTRVPLVLKTVCGLGCDEIAGALLAKEGTIAQRLTRAKAKLQAAQVRLEMPPRDQVAARLDDVLAVLYLLFNEGYRAHRGADLVRTDLVHDAVRLADLLLVHPETRGPEVHALLALMLLQGARVSARTDAAGDLLTLAEQDRNRWDQAWLRAGFAHLQQSLGGVRLTAFHVEAAIAATHARARTYADTDWPIILREYDRLLEIADTGVVRLNRAVAVAKVHGAAAGLAALAAVAADGPLADYFLLPVTKAQLLWELGDREGAAACYRAALALPCSEPERRLLRRRLETCADEPPPRW